MAETMAQTACSSGNAWRPTACASPSRARSATTSTSRPTRMTSSAPRSWRRLRRVVQHLTAESWRLPAAARAAVTAERQEIGRTVASLGLPTEGVATELDAAILDANGLLNPKLSLLRERRDWPRWAPPEADVRAWEREFAAAVAPDFLGFRFTPGMLFGAPLQWWSSRRPRRTPHAGLDFRPFARRRAGSDEPEEEVAHDPARDRVCAAYARAPAAVFADFVASTVLGATTTSCARAACCTPSGATSRPRSRRATSCARGR